MVDRTQRVPRKCARPRLFLGALSYVLLSFCALLIVPPGQSGEPAQAKYELFRDGSTQAPATAAAATGFNDPVGTLAILLTAKSLSIWETAAAPPHERAALSADKAPSIDPDLLAGVEDKAPMRSAAENYAEARAYNYLLVQADATPAAAFAKSTRGDLTFAHLFEEPQKYRGQVVHIEGRLKRLRRFDAPRIAVKQGVPVLYEGWIFGDAYFSNPYCVIATAVPKSIPLGDTLAHRVAFDGYFFKRYRYSAGDGLRDAPLLIGHVLLDRESAAAGNDSGDAFAKWLLPTLIAVLVASALLVASLHWWFRRGDRQIRRYLDTTRNASFVEPGPESP